MKMLVSMIYSVSLMIISTENYSSPICYTENTLTSVRRTDRYVTLGVEFCGAISHSDPCLQRDKFAESYHGDSVRVRRSSIGLLVKAFKKQTPYIIRVSSRQIQRQNVRLIPLSLIHFTRSQSIPTHHISPFPTPHPLYFGNDVTPQSAAAAHEPEAEYRCYFLTNHRQAKAL